MFEKSRDCPEKQPNSPHVDFMQGRGQRKRDREREREKKRGREEEDPEVRSTRSVSEASLGESLHEAIRTRASCPKCIRELGLIGYTVTDVAQE